MKRVVILALALACITWSVRLVRGRALAPPHGKHTRATQPAAPAKDAPPFTVTHIAKPDGLAGLVAVHFKTAHVITDTRPHQVRVEVKNAATKNVVATKDFTPYCVPDATPSAPKSRTDEYVWGTPAEPGKYVVSIELRSAGPVLDGRGLTGDPALDGDLSALPVIADHLVDHRENYRVSVR